MVSSGACGVCGAGSFSGTGESAMAWVCRGPVVGLTGGGGVGWAGASACTNCNAGLYSTGSGEERRVCLVEMGSGRMMSLLGLDGPEARLADRAVQCRRCELRCVRRLWIGLVLGVRCASLGEQWRD